MADRCARTAVVIGAGIGGLAAAIALARDGYAVTVLERAACAGGKMREVKTGGFGIDAGPTVLTMRWVFDSLFESVGERLEHYIALQKLSTIARHAWSGGARLDLCANEAASADAIGAFAGASEAQGFLNFCAEARRMYETLLEPFLTAPKPNPFTLTTRIGLARLDAVFAIRPFDTMWRALGDHFLDQRLRQLFGRYATYCGSSPFTAPATLMLIAHVEQDGVWSVDGGMQRLAEALTSCAEKLGVAFLFSSEVSEIDVHAGRVSGVRLQNGDRIDASNVVCNADPSALAAGLFGNSVARAINGIDRTQRSLSAITWAVQAKSNGLPLVRHNVFFSDDYTTEFSALKQNLPSDPTVYVCAQDRDGSEVVDDAERLLILVNAPAYGDARSFTSAELDICETNMLHRLRRCGLEIELKNATRTTPTEFNTLFPATGGALYGRATQGWAASFQRPGARTKVPGLYLAGGGVHPGAGVPMAALSGQLAAQSILADRDSTSRSHQVVMPGGTSTRSAITNSTA